MKKEERIEVPDKVQVFEDNKTRAKSIAFPITFPDATAGAIIVSRLSRQAWIPKEVIKEIIIVFR
jgi:hypothetical protein